MSNTTIYHEYTVKYSQVYYNVALVIDYLTFAFVVAKNPLPQTQGY